MLTSATFPVFITGTHSLIIPDKIALTFINEGHSRVEAKAYFKLNKISFHAKLRPYKNQFLVSFGKRYQKELGVTAQDTFNLKLLEDTSKYGVEVPEEFSAVFESDPEALAKFEVLTDGKKRSLIYFIIRIKNSQTRIDKALMISENLKRGITDQKMLLKKI